MPTVTYLRSRGSRPAGYCLVGDFGRETIVDELRALADEARDQTARGAIDPAPECDDEEPPPSP